MTDAYPKDQKLMESLGLRTTGFHYDWTDLGTIVHRAAKPDGEYGPVPQTTIKVEVAALPAQFWRFTVTRPRDAAETLSDGTVRGIYEPLEVRVITTGSGGFTDYWPTVVLMAEHMLEVETGQVENTEKKDRRLAPIDKRVWDASLPCPDCGNDSVIGFLYLDQHRQHQHTHYVCTFWKSPDDKNDYLKPGYNSAKDRCGWHGWSVPGWDKD